MVQYGWLAQEWYGMATIYDTVWPAYMVRYGHHIWYGMVGELRYGTVWPPNAVLFLGKFGSPGIGAPSC